MHWRRLHNSFLSKYEYEPCKIVVMGQFNSMLGSELTRNTILFHPDIFRCIHNDIAMLCHEARDIAIVAETTMWKPTVMNILDGYGPRQQTARIPQRYQVSIFELVVLNAPLTIVDLNSFSSTCSALRHSTLGNVLHRIAMFAEEDLKYALSMLNEVEHTSDADWQAIAIGGGVLVDYCYKNKITIMPLVTDCKRFHTSLFAKRLSLVDEYAFQWLYGMSVCDGALKYDKAEFYSILNIFKAQYPEAYGVFMGSAHVMRSIDFTFDIYETMVTIMSLFSDYDN